MENQVLVPMMDDHEAKRLASLRCYEINYDQSETQFDEITQLAKIICEVPSALITFLDESNSWIKSKAGLPFNHTERKLSFCSHTIMNDFMMEITDATRDERFKNNPFVTGFPGIRFYAGIPITDLEGNRIGALCVIDQKPGQLNERQHEALKVLAHSVTNLLEIKKQQKQLIEEKQRAEAASQAKADFLATMSHEIRTPLNGISGIAHLLLQENPLPRQLEYIKTLKFSANNLMCIINDILDFSKIEAGKITIEKIKFNLWELLNELKNANAFRALEKNIDLVLDYQEDLPENIIADPVRLSQILNNLIGNAIKFTHRGCVTVKAKFEHSLNGKPKIVFTVQDTGIGIAKEKQSLLFTRFNQGDSSITRKFGGTGLGLAITRRLLELQGSSIQLESEEAKGSTFWFELPVALPEQSVSPKLPAKNNLTSDSSALVGMKVLLVEDNPVNVLIAAHILRGWGVFLDTVSNGKEALAYLRNKTVDLVLMDLQMPEMDGYEAAKRIRMRGNPSSELPILALSASVATGEKDLAFECGMNDFITKPFNPTDLFKKLKKYYQ